MRVIIGLLAAIAVLVWAGFELRGRSRDMAEVLWALAGLLLILLTGAWLTLTD